MGIIEGAALSRPQVKSEMNSQQAPRHGAPELQDRTGAILSRIHDGAPALHKNSQHEQPSVRSRTLLSEAVGVAIECLGLLES